MKNKIFKSVRACLNWIAKNTSCVVVFENNCKIWINEKGEILHSNNHHDFYDGKKVNTEKLKVGSCLRLKEDEKTVVVSDLKVEKLDSYKEKQVGDVSKYVKKHKKLEKVPCFLNF